jgi:hypothetical protein
MTVASWPEVSQADYERLEVEALAARQHFLNVLAGTPVVRDAYGQWQAAERQAFEGRRGRREAEAKE